MRHLILTANNETNYGFSKESLRVLRGMGLKAEPHRKLATCGSTEFESIRRAFDDDQEDLYEQVIAYCEATGCSISAEPS